MPITQKDTDFLIDFLKNSNPALYVGAGFSLGATRPDCSEIPTSDQFAEIVLSHINNTYLKAEIATKSLSQICESLADEDEEKLDNAITESFSGFKPLPFHSYIQDYKWKGIYSLNVDDIIEQIYPKDKLQVHFSSKKNNDPVADDKQQLYKLHGSILNPQREYIFSESQYNNFITDKSDFRLISIIHAFQTVPFIVIGSSFEEQELRHFIAIYNHSNQDLLPHDMIFINPKPTETFKTKIKKIKKAKLIEISTEEFLSFIHSNKTSIETEFYKQVTTLKRNGFLIHEMLTKHYPQKNSLSSKLYFGYEPTWEDILYNVAVPYKWISETKEMIISDDKNKIFILKNTIYSGKTTLLKILFLLFKDLEDAEMIFCDLGDIIINNLIETLSNSTKRYFYIFIDEGTSFYSVFNHLLSKDKRFKLIVTANNKDHDKSRYILPHDITIEIEINNRLLKQDISKLKEVVTNAGFSGNLKNASIEEWLKLIPEGTPIVGAMYKITEAERFKQYYIDYISKNEIYKKDEFQITIIVSIIYKIGIQRVRQLLFEKQGFNNAIYKNLESIIQIINDKELKIISPYAAEAVLEKATHDMILKSIENIAKKIAPLILENDYTKSYWKRTYEAITKYKTLKNILNLSKKEIKQLYENIHESYSDKSYYWLQLGLLEQSFNNFEQARMHFNAALAIHHNAYMLLHALARNYCIQARNIENINQALTYFTQGEDMFFELVNNYEFMQSKSYSVHSLLCEKIRFCKKINKDLTSSEKRRYSDILNMALKIDPYDKYLIDLQREFNNFTMKDNFNSLRFDEIYHKYETDTDDP